MLYLYTYMHRTVLLSGLQQRAVEFLCMCRCYNNNYYAKECNRKKKTKFLIP